MRKITAFLSTLFILALFIPLNSFATHIVGGTLTYVHNGGSSYTVSLKLYRDCGGVGLPGSVNISVLGYNGATFAPSKNININLSSSSFLNANLDSCAQAPNPIPCVQEGIYTRTVNNLPPNPGGYHLYYQLIARNTGITNINATGNNIGESFYAYIPGSSVSWFEDFSLPNGTTVDAGLTAWTGSAGTTPPNSAVVNTNRFQINGANNAEFTWTSEIVNIASLTLGANLSVNLSDASNLENSDSVLVSYRLNGGPLIPFTNNGIISNDFGNIISSETGLFGTTVQIVIRVHYGGSSNNEIIRFDNVIISGNDFVANNSPDFDNFPPLFLCANTQFTFNHVATDPDGDSLFYSLYTPYDGDNNAGPKDPTFPGNIATFLPVVWLGGFSANNPLGGAPITINSSTGILTGTPTMLGQFLVGIKVAEYRNGVYLGEILRDFQFNIINCPPPAAALIVTGDTLTVCSGNTITFPNNSDAIANNWLWNFGDLTTTNDTSTLEFPTWTYPGPGTFTALLITNEGTSCADSSTATVTVTTPPASPTLTSNSPICVGATLNLTANLITGATYSWTGPNGFSSTLQNPTVAGVTALANGTYSATVTVDGCTSSPTSLSVIVSPIPATPTASSNSPICVGSALNLTTPLVAGATYSWTGPNGFSSALQNPTITGATVLASGVYNVRVVIAGCPSVSGGTTVTVSPTPTTPTPSSNSPICVGVTLNLTTPLVAGATYSWTGPNGFSSALQNPTIAGATSLAAGTYNLIITVAGCPSAAASTAVIVSPIPTTPIASSNSPICIGSTLNLTTPLVAGATYSWTGPNGFSSALQNPTIAGATALASGTYDLTIMVAGCPSAIGSTTTIVSPIPTTPIASSNSPICIGSTLNLTTPLVAGATYSWTGPNGFSSVLQNPTITGATALASGTYDLTITVGGCPSAAGSTTVTASPIPTTPIASSNSPICIGSTLNLTTPLVAGATYSWTGPNGFSSALQNPTITGATALASGTYDLTITIAGCPSAVGSITAIVSPIPATPIASSNSPICIGSTLNLTTPLVAGATYSWTGPNGFSSALQNPTITGATALASGTYDLTITVAGCPSAVGSTTVTASPIPTTPIASSNSPICVGATLNLTTPLVAGATYSWTGPNGFSSALQNPTIASATSLATGAYNLIITVAGCPSTAASTAVIVSPIPATPIASSNSPICIGSTLNLTTPLVAGATYSWTGPNGFSSALQNPTIAGATALASGTYDLTITVAGCPSAVGSTTTIVSPIPTTPIASSNSPICVGATLNLTTPLVAGATYSWTGPNGFSSALQNPTITSSVLASAGTYNIIITVGGCPSAAGSTPLTVNPTPATPAATNNGPLCIGQNLNLTTPLVAGATYSWTGPNGFSSALQNPSINSVTTADLGIYSVTITSIGCPSSAGSTTVIINNPPLTPALSSNSPICTGTTLNLTTPLVVGATYSWTGPNGFSSTLQNPSIINITATGAGVYSLIITVGTCVSPAGTTTIIVNPTPVISLASNNGPLCEGATLNLTTSNIVGATYDWSGPNSFTSTSQNPSISLVSVLNSGVYSVTATLNGCPSASLTTTVVIDQASSSDAGSDLFVCNGDSAFLIGTITNGSGSGIWSSLGSGTFSPSNTNLNATYIPSAADYTAGSVTLTLASTNNGSCLQSIDSLLITFTIPPTVNAGSSTTICDNAVAQLSGIVSGASTTGQWSTSGDGTFSPNNTDLNAQYTPGTTDITNGTVTITLESTFSCLATDQIVITLIQGPQVDAGVDQTICITTNQVILSGSVTGSTTTGIWTSTGTGTFTPSNTNPNTTYNLTAADSAAGNFMLILTSTNGGSCLAGSDTMLVTLTTIPTVNAGVDTTFCANNLANLNGIITGGASTGIWSTSGTGIFSSVNTDLNALYVPSTADVTTGSVTLTLTSTGACVVITDNLILSITPAPIVFAGNDTTICDSSSLQLNGVILGGTTTGIWTTSGDGTFAPSTTNLNAAYLPGTTDLANGSFDLFLASTNNGDCNAVNDTISVLILSPPTADAGGDQLVCGASNVSLSGSISGGFGGIWSSLGTGTFTNPLNLTTDYLPSTADTTSGSIQLILASDPANSCGQDFDTITVTFVTQPQVNAGLDFSVCANNDTIQLSGTSSNGNGLWTTNGDGIWSPSDSVLSTTYIPGVQDSISGQVVFELSPLNAQNCPIAIDTIIVTITPAPVVDAGTDISVCLNNLLVSLNGSVTGASSTGVWTTNGTGTFTPDNLSLTANYQPSNADTTSGLIWFALTSSNNGLCNSETDTVLVTFDSSPIVSAGLDITTCQSNTAFLFATLNGGGTVLWETTNGLGSFTPDSISNPAGYLPAASDSAAPVEIIATYTNGCGSITDTVLINVLPSPGLSMNYIVNCETFEVQFDAIIFGGTIQTINWDFGDTNTDTTASPLHTYAVSGTYDVKLFISTTDGCTDSVSQSIVIENTPIADFDVSDSIVFIDDLIFFNDTSLNATSWQWDFGDLTGTYFVGDTTYSYPNPGTYTTILIASNNSGCSDTISMNIVVNPYEDNDDIVINPPVLPTAFTPNGDGHNDILFVRGGPFEVFDLRVYNEWGNQIFKATDQTDGWNGNYKGNEQPVGVYIYLFEGTTIDGVKYSLSKDFSLIR